MAFQKGSSVARPVLIRTTARWASRLESLEWEDSQRFAPEDRVLYRVNVPRSDRTLRDVVLSLAGPPLIGRPAGGAKMVVNGLAVFIVHLMISITAGLSRFAETFGIQEKNIGPKSLIGYKRKKP